MKVFNFRIVKDGNTYFLSVSAYNLVSAYQEAKENYPEGRIVLL